MSETQTQTRFEQARATARKVLTDARARAVKATTRGRQRLSAIGPRARELSDRARTRVKTTWHEQVEGARAGLARVRAALGKRA